MDRCPDCGARLQGGWVQWTREVLELPLAPVPADNNAAERRLRHLVIRRKISGGTRWVQGTATAMALASLFGTWRAQGQNPFIACRQLLTAPQL